MYLNLYLEPNSYWDRAIWKAPNISLCKQAIVIEAYVKKKAYWCLYDQITLFSGSNGPVSGSLNFWNPSLPKDLTWNLGLTLGFSY
jgi:hypothetical protein